MSRTYYKKDDRLIYLEGDDLEAPEGAEEISKTRYEELRALVRDELNTKKQEYLQDLRSKKLEAREALVALGLSAELAAEVIK